MTEPPAPPTPPGPPGGGPPPPPGPRPGDEGPSDRGTSAPSPQDAAGTGAGMSTGGTQQDRVLMIVLAYLYILCFVPLLMQKEDAEIQWHAKQGTVLMGIDFVLAVLFGLLTVTGLGCLLAPIYIVVVIGFLVLFVVRVIAVVKGIQGERFAIPGVARLAESF